jgi:rhodanese-related sulfurtransferase
LSNALRPGFATWLGWLVGLDRRLAFVLDADQDRSALVRQCLDVGLEHLVGELAGGLPAWEASGRATAASIPMIEAIDIGQSVLDVRQTIEYAAGHVPGARHVELGAVPTTAIPDEPITVMCGHGERAMTAASLLAARGHRHVSVFAGGPGSWAAHHRRPLENGA